MKPDFNNYKPGLCRNPAEDKREPLMMSGLIRLVHKAWTGRDVNTAFIHSVVCLYHNVTASVPSTYITQHLIFLSFTVFCLFELSLPNFIQARCARSIHFGKIETIDITVNMQCRFVQFCLCGQTQKLQLLPFVRLMIARLQALQLDCSKKLFAWISSYQLLHWETHFYLHEASHPFR